METINTPLTYAIINGHDDAILLLIKEGADVTKRIEVKDERVNIWCHPIYWITPLFIYVKYGSNKDIINLFIQMGIDVNESNHVPITYDDEIMIITVNESGDGLMNRTPFELAVSMGNIEIVKTILELCSNTIDIHRRYDSKRFNRRDRMNIIHIAAIHGNITMLDLLMRYIGNNDHISSDRTQLYDTMLHIALYEGHDDVVKWILEHPGVDILAYGFNRRTPIDVAITHRRCYALDLILSYDSEQTAIAMSNDNYIKYANPEVAEVLRRYLTN